MFRTEDHCVAFINKLDNTLMQFQLLEPMEFNRRPEQVTLLSPPDHIYRRDYDPTESDSEHYEFVLSGISHIS